MKPRAVRYVIALLIGIISLITAGYSAKLQLADKRLIANLSASQIAPLPAAVLPGGSPKPAARPPLDLVQRQSLADALYRDPLNARLFNAQYVDGVRSKDSDAEIRSRAALLAQLGWRYTPAQQNLMFQDILDGDFDGAIDRADALLRRQKVPSLAFAVLGTMETIPGVHQKVVDRLLGNPRWRSDYLSVIGPQSNPAALDARVSTLRTLSATPQGITRDEIAPSLNALVATGRARTAYQVWTARSGRKSGNNLVYDSDFMQAAAVAATPENVVPFEWHLGQDLGYSVQAAAEGLTISWDRRGVPQFLSQLVPVEAGRSYDLLIDGRISSGSLSQLLAPAIVCGVTAIPFVLKASERTKARYKIIDLPEPCDTGVLTINGALDTGSGEIDLQISKVTLTSLP